MSTSGKGKVPASTNGVKTYSKEVLNDKISKLTAANIQLVTDKIKIEKVKVNLKVNKIRLFDEKNSLIAKRKELRIEIAALNITGHSNILVCRY